MAKPSFEAAVEKLHKVFEKQKTPKSKTKVKKEKKNG
tara:strand:+ start:371 stop:481 length:111 start_codon:yes stop_codon:yes gene_type:complete